jgi:hypothetical protein
MTPGQLKTAFIASASLGSAARMRILAIEHSFARDG